MTAKTLVRTLVFLALLFVVLYTGMHNTHSIDFRFPMLLDRKVSQPAAFLFFGFFAIGVLAGMMLHAGGGSAKGSAPKKKN